ncbi:hypothetical protein NIES2100_20260 [Calothrix sp. NIES-2100]|uniref:hypothetical protein n=1 Tax=Calothrix sp. NIES-2100 TaxID=1954172 RepID=UPI000B620F32|nr:hypothetical protein NIES2100_20260 [Calothrix sp. NIES-2100]
MSYSAEELAQEIGGWVEGVTEGGYWIVTTHLFAIFAIRFLVIQQGQPPLEAIALFLGTIVLPWRLLLQRIIYCLTELFLYTIPVKFRVKLCKVQVAVKNG